MALIDPRRAHISGRHNPEIAADLFPDWPEDRRTQFYMDKEERFRSMAGARSHSAGSQEMSWAASQE